jgi:peptide deformylase
MTKHISFIDGNMVEWELLKLVDKYDPILRKPTVPVDFNTVKNIASLSMSMMKTVEHLNGLGLSANQVGLSHSMCVINHIEEGKIYCLINPIIIEKSNTMHSFNEGCLSFPGLFLKVERPSWVFVEFQAGNGEILRKKFEGVYATCVQHELDHLNGIVYTDLVSPIKLEIAKQKVNSNIRKAKRRAKSLI